MAAGEGPGAPGPDSRQSRATSSRYFSGPWKDTSPSSQSMSAFWPVAAVNRSDLIPTVTKWAAPESPQMLSDTSLSSPRTR